MIPKCQVTEDNLFGKRVHCSNIPQFEKVVNGLLTIHRRSVNKNTGHADVIVASRPIKWKDYCFYHSTQAEVGRETGNEWATGRRPENHREAKEKDYI